MAQINTKNYLKSKNYSIGLDIGTNSVGWAIVDENMNLAKRYKKHLWGSRLFDERETASARRKLRTARRRLLRRRVRLAMLDKIFADFIGDENFFVRMRESFLQIDDRSFKNKNILFDNNNQCCINKPNGEKIEITNDADYYRLFPTIYHLRRSIIEHADWQFDPKLIYLAIHHILKSRGNFINEDMNSQNDQEQDQEMFTKMIQSACDLFELDFDECKDLGNSTWLYILYSRAHEFLDILQDKSLGKKEKQPKVEATFNCKKENKQIAEICKLLIGYGADLKKIFPDRFDKQANIKLSDAGIDEKILSFGDCEEFLQNAKNLYSRIEYNRLMNGKKYLSDLMIERYNRYKQQLKDLKKVFLAIYPRQNGTMNAEYRKFFRDLKTTNNYARYTYSAGSCDQKEFVKNIENIIKNHTHEILSADVYDTNGDSIASKAKKLLIAMNSKLVEEGKETIFADISLSNFDRQKEIELGFLQRPRVVGNGIFPKQSHESELRKILNNQSKFWNNFLNSAVQEKILALFNFKIDYFVGPLGIRKDTNNQNFGWVVRKKDYENEQITPFNYKEAIDFEATRTEFITRMTGTCSYLIGEKALPKNSMIYCYFDVLNELNNLSLVIDKKQIKLPQLSRDSGMNFCDEIINRLLETNTYKQKDLINLLSPYYDNFTVIGFANAEKLNSNLKPIRDMTRIIYGISLNATTIMSFLRSEKADFCEKIIRDITIFGQSKQSLQQSLNKYLISHQLNETQIKELCNLQYTGWGNLSKELIFGLKSQDTDHLTILELMEQEGRNFMSIFANEKYGFKQQVDAYLSKCKKNIPEMIDEFACSPSVKRGITQAFKVVDELVHVMGHAPQNVFIEFARGENLKQKGKVTKNRQTQMKNKYDEAKKLSESLYNDLIQENKNLQSDLSNLTDETKKKLFDNEKVMLYFLQAGKCMYTNQTLYLNNLSDYEVDHIVPRSLTTDNSFDNKVLVLKKANQEKRDNETLPSNLRQTSLWESLKTLGLLTNEKYLRLIRTNLSENDKSRFIKRQIVETRQIIKNTTLLLDTYFKNKNMNTKVYSVKAELNSGFRHQFGYPKGDGGRAINDLHHAKDAYITTLVGTYLLNQGALDNIEAMKLSNKFYHKNALRSAQNGFVLWSLKNAITKRELWNYDTTILTRTILKNFDRNYYSADCFISKKINAKPTGAFYKETKFKNKENAIAWGEEFKYGMITIGKKSFDKELEPIKYGGFSAINPAKFAIIQKQKTSGFDYKFISIPTMVTCDTATITESEYLNKNYPKYTVVRYVPKYAILTEKSFGTAIISGEKDKYCANQLIFSRKNKELYKFIYLIFKHTEKHNELEVVNYYKWLKDKNYPILTKKQTTSLSDEEQVLFVRNYIHNCVQLFKEEYISHLRKNFIRKDFADIFEPYFDEILMKNTDWEKTLTIFPALLKITQCNGARAELNSFSTENIRFKGEYGRITNAIKDWDNTYIIHNSITGIYSKKEKIIKNQ